MKKLLVLFIAVAMTFGLAGCGSGSNDTGSLEPAPAQEKQAPLDLTGMWVQEDAGADYMTAVIQDDGRIGVFFLFEGDDEPWTYWVGTYDAPTESKNEYVWTSQNTYGGEGLYASSADTKEFTYKNGKLTYTLTINGESADISLVKKDWDTSKIPASAFGSVKIDKSSFKNVEISDSGWFVANEKWVKYYVVLHNPNEGIAVELPAFRITARDAGGLLLGTEDQYLSIIYPGQDFVFGSQAFSVDEMPAKVEFEMLDAEEYDLKNASTMEAYKPLEVVNAGLKSDKLLGEINNPNDYDIDTAVLVAICRNAVGEIVAIENTYVDDVKAGASTPFSTSVHIKESVDSVEFFANRWD